MSHYKLKNIVFANNIVAFESKSNNSNAPYQSDYCSVAEFLHKSLGNLFQYEDEKINTIMKRCISEFKDLDTFWSEVERNGIQENENISSEDKDIFIKYCFQLSNLTPKSKPITPTPIH